MSQGKLIIFSAPSGSGKTTLVRYLLSQGLDLAFSVSCTSRAPRGTEQEGVDYYFLTPEEFRRRIENDEFLEYEEVYTDKFYGTLKSEVERLSSAGHTVVFDVDVKGGVNIKKYYGDRALSLFVQAPSIEELSRRLHKNVVDAALFSVVVVLLVPDQGRENVDAGGEFLDFAFCHVRAP